jgi:zinc protease
MLKRLVLPVCALLVLAAATASAGELAVTTRKLENGCRLAVVQNRQAPVVSLRIYVTNTGSLYENEFLGCGISHYLEHLVSGGTTTKRTEAESALILQKIGGETNAFTNRSTTCYHGQTHARYFDTILELFADWVQNCALLPREVAREKGVIVKEMIKGLDEPNRVAYQLFMETMFQSHPVRHPTIGYRDTFLEISRDDLKRFLDERYVPNNTIVVVGGDVDAEEALDKLAKAFGSWKRRPDVDMVKTLPGEPRQMGRRFAEVEMGVREALVRIGFHTIDLSHPDLYALDMLAAVLGNGRTSRLHRRLVETDGLTDAVQVGSHTPHYGAGVFSIVTQCPYEKAPAFERGVMGEIRRLAKEPPTRDELERAKALVERDYVMNQLKADDQAASVAIDLMGTGQPNFSAAYVERMRAVTGDQVSAMARKYLGEDNETIIVVKPGGAPSAFGPPKRAGGERLAACPVHPHVRRPGGGRCPGCGREMVIPKPAGATDTRKVVLDNGLTLLIQRNPATPTIGVQAFFRAGVLWETDENAGISNLMARLLLRGTKNRTAAQIAETLEGAGARMTAESGNNTFGLSMTLHARDLSLGLDLFADALRNPLFPATEVETETRNSKLLIERQAGNWYSQAMRFFRPRMFATHPYRRDRFGTLESIGAIDRAAIAAYHARCCVPSRGVVAVFGDIDPARAELQLREVFENWQAPASGDLPPVPVEAPLTKSSEHVLPTDKGQVVISLGYTGAALDSDDRYVLDVIDAAISGINLPSGRLHHALRGEKDLVYYVHAMNWNGFGAGSFYVVCPCRPDLYDEVIAIIRREIARVAKEGFTPQELAIAKGMCITVGQLSRQTNNERAVHAVLDELYGFGWDASRSHAEKIERITNEDVMRVAKKHFAHSVLTLTAPKAWVEGRK